MFSLVAVSAQLAEQLVAIETGGDDAVHQARTRVRRLRSILSVYRRAFEQDETRRLRERLKQLGDRLGAVRDLEVRALAVEALVPFSTDPVETGRARALATAVWAEHQDALTGLLHQLQGRSQRRLLADVQAFAAEPPFSDAGRDDPERVERKGLKKARKRALREQSDGGGDSGGSLAALHETRKAARRLRYAAEAVADDIGRDAVHLAAAAEAVHDALGDHRDAVLLAAYLREHGLPGLARRCDRDAEDALDRGRAAMAALAAV